MTKQSLAGGVRHATDGGGRFFEESHRSRRAQPALWQAYNKDSNFQSVLGLTALPRAYSTCYTITLLGMR